MEIREVLVRASVLLLFFFIQLMLAGGLAVTLHSMVTVSSLAGVLLLPLITILLRGTAKGEYA